MSHGKRRVGCECECNCGKSDKADVGELVKIESFEDFSTLEKKLEKKEEFNKLVIYKLFYSFENTNFRFKRSYLAYQKIQAGETNCNMCDKFLIIAL